MLLDSFRTDRAFESFLDIQERRIDAPVNGVVSPPDREGFVRKLRRNRKVRRLAADQSYEKFIDEKESGFSGTFFDWLIENQEMILGLIRTILALFAI